MNRPRIVSLATCFGLLATVVAAAAQEPLLHDAEAGVRREPLTSEAVRHLEGYAGPLLIERLTIDPGAESTVAEDAAAMMMLVIEAGSLEVESPAPATIRRADAADGARGEVVPADALVVLVAGDSFVSLEPAGTVLRNGGAEPARVVSLGFGTMPTAPAATPDAGERSSEGLVLALALVVPPPCPEGTEPGSPALAATPGGGGGGGGAGGIAIAIAAAPACIDVGTTPVP